jgi:hypothetical protein
MTGAQVREWREGKVCAICKDPQRTVVPDHCHETLQFRGPLCDLHNRALGFFEDNIEHLLAAVEYLRSARERRSPDPGGK